MISEEILDNYILTRWEYAIGVEPRMSDAEYNSLHAILLKELPDNEYVKRAWSDDPCPLELLKKYNRPDLYRNIKIQYGSESITSIRSMDELKRVFGNLNKLSRLSFKIDGWNTQTNYYNKHAISANTRGREANFVEANVILSVIPNEISLGKRVKVIGEAIIPNDKWEMFKAKTGNTGQRHSVSTVIANNESEFLDIIAYNVVSTDIDLPKDKYNLLKSWGFKTPMFVWVNNYDELLAGIKMLGKLKDKVNYETDGLVLENDDTQIALRVGEWQESDILSYVTGYTQCPTAYGFSMTINVYPVKSNGVTISNPNITNINLIVKNDLRVGSPIAFTMRSNANPVVNFTRTKLLQEEYDGRYDEYCRMIEQSSNL